MRGKPKYKKHEIKPDPKYNNVVLEKFINYLMQGGAKATARKVVYKALEIAESKAKTPPMKIFSQAIRNVSPVMEVKTRRVGGANYQVPVQVQEDRRRFLAMKWIIAAAREGRRKQGQALAQSLASEFLAAAKGEGTAVAKKEQIHRMAEANKAFAYLAW
jgi:small subunit ribosomal protein S7